MPDFRSLTCSLVFYIGTTVLLFANQEPLSLFYQGNVAYTHGHYNEAIQAYEAILAYGQSPELYFNLQEAYLQAGRFSQALLTYERLALLAPYSKLRAPAFEKIKASYQNPPWTLAQRLARILPSPNGWSWVLGVSFWGLLASIRGLWLNKERSRKPYGISYCLLLLSLGGLTGAGVACWGWQTYQKTGIVLHPTPLKLAPTPQSPYLDILHLGTYVQFEKQSEGHYLVRLPQGQKGWVTSQDVGPFINPKTAQ